MKKNEVEKWKSIPGFGNRYLVSSMGRVKMNNEKERILSTFFINGEELYVELKKKEGERKKKRVIQLVADAFIPQKTGCEKLIHLDGDVNNNHVSNIKRVTKWEFNRHWKNVRAKMSIIWEQEEIKKNRRKEQERLERLKKELDKKKWSVWENLPDGSKRISDSIFKDAKLYLEKGFIRKYFFNINK